MPGSNGSIPHAGEGPPESVLPGIPRLLGLGLLAAALFSITFVLNRAMSLDGGHWVWSASLRYFDTALLLSVWVLLERGPRYFTAILRLFAHRLRFWLIAGGVGFGVFYACCCFAADHAPAWIIAATWQLTVLATPLVLWAFGNRVPLRGLMFLGLIFLGTLILNAERILSGVPLAQTLAGVLPVLVAAVAYPVGNQLLNRAKYSWGKTAEMLADPRAAVLLLTLGSLPVFVALILMTMPPPPSHGQIIATAVIALISGCLATTLFIYARNLSNDPLRIAAVDATQAGEVGFALLGETLFLGGTPPDFLSCVGLVAVVAGLIGFTFQSRP